MKQYIAQLMMLLSLVGCSSAMEVIKPDPSVPCNDICYFNEMPRDILEYIARFLMETEEEFIERTQITSLIISEAGDFYCRTFRVRFMKHALCPDEEKCLVLGRNYCREYEERFDRTFLNSFYEDKIMIIDLPKGKGAEHKVMYEKALDNFDKYKCCALSRGGNRIGMVHSYSYRGRSYDRLDIQKTTTQEQKVYYLPAALCAERLFFNKQGTHIILHGKEYLTQEKLYHIVSLKNVTSHQMDVEPEKTNQLQNYFRDKFVCNKNIEGEK